MDYSAANTALWNIIIQFGLIAGAILLATGLRNCFGFLKKSLMPVSVLGGFILLILKYTGLITIDGNLMEILVYHGIALGFIAMSLRVKEKSEEKTGDLAGLKSGALIVSTYLVQGISGLVIMVLLGATVMPKLFKAAGILLPMAYGQGPGQANNIGATYEGLGFVGGRSFGLSLAAAGYVVACIVGVIMLNVLSRKGKIAYSKGQNKESGVKVDFFQADNEIPVADSIDKLSVNMTQRGNTPMNHGHYRRYIKKSFRGNFYVRFKRIFNNKQACRKLRSIFKRDSKRKQFIPIPFNYSLIHLNP